MTKQEKEDLTWMVVDAARDMVWPIIMVIVLTLAAGGQG
jgi:hypothetical protein